ncbi:MAG: glutamine synthetase III [Lentisphaeria bacterium]|nr:glutamine synthetase III [Lentisphaeria bacterium]
MSNLNRLGAIKSIASRQIPAPQMAAPAEIGIYAEDVFNEQTMRAALPQNICEKLLETIRDLTPLDPAIANDVAQAMKCWALDRGATHYTHWFLPLNGSTAEKHDAFLEIRNGEAIQSFSGKNLIMGEPDASSFPSGGLRSTFEARGYTAWDPTSPDFIKRHSNGATLCIPTVFCSYTGEALDKKTPLLRSIQTLTAATKRLMKCFGKPEEHVCITLGAEQEYFLIDKHFYLQRPDLLQTSRTIFGAPPPKHQQLEDHYFGSIRARVLNFMTEVERDLWRLGIPARTRHNEVAPAQFELAPMFEDVNLACDHNMLVMEVLRQTAERNGMICLLHEKPFAGVNGSGKHNNWSISYGDRNLLNPGDDPLQNAIFLTVLCAIIEAVDRHADLLRATVAGAGNDHRLGANEAPPSVISMYLGAQLTEVIERLEHGKLRASKAIGSLRLGVDTLPPLPRDTTDRNRTSPFAFTGNKFEFRAPGSSQSCSGPNVILNTIVAEAFDRIAGELEPIAGAPDFHDRLQKLLRKIIREHKRVLYSGDCYTEEWLAEAARRGLPNNRDTMAALQALIADENIALMEKHKVYNRRELESRYEVSMEEYHRKVRIEGGIALEIATSMILPVAQTEYGRLVRSCAEAQAAGIRGGLASTVTAAEELGATIDRLHADCQALREALGRCHEEILAAAAQLRDTVDGLERQLSDECWPLPKYREMLFIY